MKPDLCPFVCHSSGFHVISFEYLLRSQSRYRFIRLSHALLHGSALCLPSLSDCYRDLFVSFEKTLNSLRFMYSFRFIPPLTSRRSKTDGRTHSSYNTVQPHQAIGGPCSSHSGPQLDMDSCLLYHFHVTPAHQTNTLRRPLQMTKHRHKFIFVKHGSTCHRRTSSSYGIAFLSLLESQVSGSVPVPI